MMPMQEQHKKILSEITWRGEISVNDADFVNWYRTIFKGKMEIRKRLVSVLNDMWRMGYIEKRVDKDIGMIHTQYIYNLKE